MDLLRDGWYQALDAAQMVIRDVVRGPFAPYLGAILLMLAIGIFGAPAFGFRASSGLWIAAMALSFIVGQSGYVAGTILGILLLPIVIHHVWGDRRE
ncbi:MAG TPA: hypothetical protein VGB20_06275 [bacterium]